MRLFVASASRTDRVHPVSWDELDDAVSAGEPARLSFEWLEVLERVERHGDLMAAVLTLEQELPELAVSEYLRARRFGH